jgi:hypothetical protein
MNKKIKFAAIAASAAMLVLLSALLISGTLADNSHFSVNENGQKYGSALFDDPYITDRPDLILAEGIDGTIGYVLKEDLHGGGPIGKPKNPEEAAAYMDQLNALADEARTRGDEYLYTIPLYASDGNTVIGEFGISIPDDVTEITE